MNNLFTLAHVCVCLRICMTACKPCKPTVGVKFILNICCMLFSAWTVKAMFCILLTYSHLAAKEKAEWKTDRGKEEGGKLFTFADGGPLRTSWAFSLCALFTSLSKRGKKGERGTGRGGWKQRVVRMTKVRHFWKSFGSSTDWQSATLKTSNRDS